MEVVAKLQQLFAKQPHYSLQELVDATQQPKQHLAEILKVWCVRHKSGEFVNKYSMRDVNTITR
jgi:hypothetical protein